MEKLPDTPSSFIGKPVPRIEDERLLTGKGLFVENRDFSDGFDAVFVRAPVAHATIRHIDTSAAQDMPGIKAVYTCADLKAAGINPLPCASPQDSTDGTPFHMPERMALPDTTIRFVGEAVVMIVADTRQQAQDAAELVDIDYEELPVNVDTASASEQAFDWIMGDETGTKTGFENAAHVVSIEGVINNRVIVSPVETRSAIGRYDISTGRYALLTQSQGVHFLRKTISQTLGIDQGDLHVVTEDVGGSFATKLMNYPEQTLVLFAAKQLGREIRWISGRDEAFLSDAHGRDHVSDAELALDAEGKFLGLRIISKASLGAYASALAPGISGKGFAKIVGHNYAFPALTCRVIGVYTNTSPTDAYRGAGKPEVTYLVERLIEKAARELEMDPVDLRRKNLVPADAMPFTHANGLIYDSGDFSATFDAAVEAADLAGFAARKAAAKEQGKLLGLAICPYLHATGGSATEQSAVMVTPDGMVQIRTGVQASGQGHQTAFAQIAATRLQIPMDRIEVIEGDSDLIPNGGGTGGSSSLPIAGTTIDRATVNMIETAKQQAADRLETAPGDITYADGAFTVIGTDRKIGLFELAKVQADEGLPGCAGNADFEGDHQTVPHGAHACEVEVDPETGRVTIERYISADDIGLKLNPPIVDGQIHGGLVQALGQAMIEHAVYDPDTGQLLSGSFMDYALPRADDFAPLEMIDVSIDTEANHLGMKGVGELSTNGGLAPIICAICNALGHDRLEMPALPERVWRAAQGNAP